MSVEDVSIPRSAPGPAAWEVDSLEREGLPFPFSLNRMKPG